MRSLDQEASTLYAVEAIGIKRISQAERQLSQGDSLISDDYPVLRRTNPPALLEYGTLSVYMLYDDGGSVRVIGQLRRCDTPAETITLVGKRNGSKIELKEVNFLPQADEEAATLINFDEVRKRFARQQNSPEEEDVDWEKYFEQQAKNVHPYVRLLMDAATMNTKKRRLHLVLPQEAFAR